jgi:hypothetical protein
LCKKSALFGTADDFAAYFPMVSHVNPFRLSPVQPISRRHKHS